VTFSKGGPLTFVSHLDLARAWERSLRRAGVPLAYSHGFNPRPRLQLAAALPLGHTAAAELLDVWLDGPLGAEGFLAAVMPELPGGLAIGRVRQVVLKEPALPMQVVTAEYRVTLEWGESSERIAVRIDRVIGAQELPHERRGKQYDLRPLIERLWLVSLAAPGGGRPSEEAGAEREIVLGMYLAARQGATARPEAVLEALGMGGVHARYHRQRLILAGLAA
jgi:radical SAM-linked protein